MQSFGDAIRRNARRHPNNLAYVFKNLRLTFKEYNDRVNQLANGLISLGYKKGDRVALIMNSSHYHCEIMGACAKTGLIYTPLSSGIKQELNSIINNAQPIVIIVGEAHAHKVDPNWGSVRTAICIGNNPSNMYNYEELLAEYPADEPEIDINLKDILSIYYTSGTTGLPKGSCLSHLAELTSTMAQIQLNHLQYHKEVGITLNPLYFRAPMINTVQALMLLASPVVITDSFDIETLGEIIQRERVTTTITVPTMIYRILEYPEIHKYDLSSLKKVCYASAPMPVAVLQRALSTFGNIFCQVYGLTEFGLATGLFAEEHCLQGPEKITRRLASCGKELYDCHLRVVREDGTDIKRDSEEVGEIIIRGDQMMSGYFNMPEQTAKAIKDGWLHTKDLAVLDEEGYVYIKDRKDDMISSGGIKIFPREVEEVISTHPAVGQVAVVGVNDEEWGEKVKAYVVLRSDTQATEQEIIDYAKSRLASYKKPKEVEFVKKLPLGTTGKILKRELRARN